MLAKLAMGAGLRVDPCVSQLTTIPDSQKILPVTFKI